MYDNLEWIDLEIARGEGRESYDRYKPNPYGDTPLGQAYVDGRSERMFSHIEDDNRRRAGMGQRVTRFPHFQGGRKV